MEKSERRKNVLPWANRICYFALTAPVTTASNERSFSKMKMINNDLRSIMTDERLNSLMFLSTEKDLTDSFDMCDMVKKWSVLKQRRIVVH